MKEALKLALEALETSTEWDMSATGKQLKSMQAILALRKTLAQPERDPWREAAAQPERDPWKEAAAQQRYFCPRCGKRLASGFVEISIHTCTPPHDKT